MEVELTETKREKIKVDVEFPIYRKTGDVFEHSEYTTYTRIDKNLKAVSIQFSNSYFDNEERVEIEIEQPYRFDHSGIDYHLGQGDYYCSKDDFLDALDRLKNIVNSIEEL